MNDDQKQVYEWFKIELDEESAKKLVNAVRQYLVAFGRFPVDGFINLMEWGKSQQKAPAD